MGDSIQWGIRFIVLRVPGRAKIQKIVAAASRASSNWPFVNKMFAKSRFFTKLFSLQSHGGIPKLQTCAP
jgi:hypothetical protein